MSSHREFATIVRLILLGGGLFLSTSALSLAEPVAVMKSSIYETHLMKLGTGKSTIIDSAVPITRASIANPEIADTVVLTPKQLYVVGKMVGATNLTLWDENGHVLRIYDVEIIPDLERLRLQLQHLLPEDRDIHIDSSHDFVTLSGKVTSSASMKEVLAIAEAYAPKKIINLLRVDEETSDPVVVDVIKGTAVDKVQF